MSERRIWTRRDMLKVGGGGVAAGVLAGFPGLRALGAQWNRETRLAVARDRNRKPDIVEVFLEARESITNFRGGTPTRVWSYNGSVPGPVIEANVGDTLIVHLTNYLPEATTVHWHGVELPAEMDGSNISQAPVPPGGTFRYEFELLTPALYWFHPHLHTNEQIEKGLHGVLLVRDPEEDERLGLPQDEAILVLDDVLLDDNNRFTDFATDPHASLSPLERAEEQINGREGNVMLVNGRELPSMTVRAGIPMRWRIVNVANTRFMRISVPGHDLHRIGGDGGLLEHPMRIPPVGLVADPASGRMVSNPDPAQGLLLVPGQRADVVLTPRGAPGDVVTVEWHDLPRGRHRAFYRDDGSIGFEHFHDDGRAPPRPLLRLRLAAGGARARDYLPPADLRSIPRVNPAGADKLVVPFGHTPPDAAGNVVLFAATRMVMSEDGMRMVGVPFDEVTPSLAQDVTVGETRVWEVVNMTAGDHTFHAHGFFFQPLEFEYVDDDNPENNRVERFGYVENIDSIRIPKRPGAMGRSRAIFRAAVRFDDNGREGRVAAYGKQPAPGFSGGWVAHCHINEHADLGMMTFIEVRDG